MYGDWHVSSARETPVVNASIAASKSFPPRRGRSAGFLCTHTSELRQLVPRGSISFIAPVFFICMKRFGFILRLSSQTNRESFTTQNDSEVAIHHQDAITIHLRALHKTQTESSKRPDLTSLF